MLQNLKELKPIVIYKAPLGQRIDPIVIRPEWEYIEVLISGKALFQVDGEDRVFSRGAMFWHVGGEKSIHRYPHDEPYACYAIAFVMDPPARPCPRVTWPADSEFLLDFVTYMCQHWYLSEEGKASIAACLYSTLACLALGPQVSPPTLPHALTTALGYLKKHFTADVHIAEVAKAAGVSADYLHTLFRQYLDRTPHQELLNLRIARAKQLLANSSFSIKEIAGECGFNSTEVFYRQFSQLTNTTPASFRRHCFLPRGEASL